MFNKQISILACAILALMLFALPTLNLVKATNFDNGFAIGASYVYTSGSINDFYFYATNDGFTSSSAYPLQIVLTASAGGYAYQNSIYIYSSTSVYLAPEVWNIALNTLIFNPTSTAISGIIGTTNSLELKIFSSSGTYYVGFYLNGTLYQRYTSGSSGTATAFDDEMTPSIVFESADPYSTDFNGIWNYGFFYGNGNMLPMNLYLGWWGYCNGITSIQTTTSYVGQNVEAFNNVAVSGYNNGFQSAYQAAFFIGDISGGNKKFGMYMNGLSDSLASLEISWYYDSNPSWFRIGN